LANPVQFECVYWGDEAPGTGGIVMSLEQNVVEILKQLPYSKQEEVLDFVRFLRSQEPAIPQPRKSVEGLWADLGASITAEDIDEARREMWGNFPREDI
jgi:hypothetical protein